MESKMERMSSSVQSWVEDHKLSTIGGVWAAAVGASVAYSRRRAPQRATSLRLIHARMHAQALTLAVLGGAAFMHYYNKSSSAADKMDLDFYSQLPPAGVGGEAHDESWMERSGEGGAAVDAARRRDGARGRGPRPRGGEGREKVRRRRLLPWPRRGGEEVWWRGRVERGASLGGGTHGLEGDLEGL